MYYLYMNKTKNSIFEYVVRYDLDGLLIHNQEDSDQINICLEPGAEKVIKFVA